MKKALSVKEAKAFSPFLRKMLSSSEEGDNHWDSNIAGKTVGRDCLLVWVEDFKAQYECYAEFADSTTITPRFWKGSPDKYDSKLRDISAYQQWRRIIAKPLEGKSSNATQVEKDKVALALKYVNNLGMSKAEKAKFLRDWK
jgi:hypothetical protein